MFYYILLIFRNVQYTICLLLGQFDYYEACVVLCTSVYEMNDKKKKERKKKKGLL